MSTETTPIDVEVNATHHLYHHTFKDGANVVLPSGQTIFFHGGKYATAVEEEVRQLDKEAAIPGSFIYIDENQKLVDPRELDPVEKIKLQAIRDYLAQQAILQAKKSGTTEYTPGETAPASTSDMVATHAQQQAARIPAVVTPATPKK